MSALDQAFVANFKDCVTRPSRPRFNFQLNVDQIAAVDAGAQILTGYLNPQANGIAYNLQLYNPYQVETLLGKNLQLLDTCLGLRNSYLNFQARAEISAARSDLIQAQLAPYMADADNGLCYSERQKRVQLRYNELLLDVAMRTWAISDGLQIVYGPIAYGPPPAELQLPPQPSPNFLDELVHWHKSAADYLEELLRRDTQYVLLLSLKNATQDGNHVKCSAANAATPRLVQNGWAADRSFLANNTVQLDFRGIGSTGILSQTDVAFFPDQTNIRLRGVAVFITSSVSGAVWNVTVKPPQMLVTVPGIPLSLGMPPIYIGGVRPRMGPVTSFVGSNYFNADPCAGQWTVEIVNNASDGTPPTPNTITDIELALLVATFPKVDDSFFLPPLRPPEPHP